MLPLLPRLAAYSFIFLQRALAGSRGEPRASSTSVVFSSDRCNSASLTSPQPMNTASVSQPIAQSIETLMSIYLFINIYAHVFALQYKRGLLPPGGRSLPSCSKSISSPFLKSGLHSQNSAVFSWMEGADPCSIPPRQRPMARATDLSRSRSHAQSSDSGTRIVSEVSDASETERKGV